MTKRDLDTRVSEHVGDTANNELLVFVLLQHSKATLHEIVDVVT